MNTLTHRTEKSQLALSTMYATRLTLRLNALSCAVFGLVFVPFSTKVSKFLGAFPQVWLSFVGAGLLLHSVHLLCASMRTRLRRYEIYYFTAGDFLWLLGSIVVLAFTDLITTFHGVYASLFVAILVSALGLAQIWTLNRLTRAEKPQCMV